MRASLLLTAFLLLVPVFSLAQTAGENAGMADMHGDAMNHDHAGMMDKAAEQGEPVRIDEKTGGMVSDAVFFDSDGKEVRLRDLVTTPTVLLPIYYRCPDVCNLLQASFARILPDVALKPGEELRVISLSFDDRDTPKDAARAKRNYMAILDGKFPPDEWKFLSGSPESISAALDSIGFHVKREGGLYAHPVAAVVLAPGGKIIQYLHGTTFLPFDITMAGTKAAAGQPGLSVKRVLSLCYSYDPQGRRYVFNILRVSGFAIFGFVAIFVAYLVVTGRKDKRKDGGA